MLPPNNLSVRRLSQEEGISEATLHKWRGRGYWVASSGNVTDEVWAEYIKNQKPPEPDDDFNVT